MKLLAGIQRILLTLSEDLRGEYMDKGKFDEYVNGRYKNQIDWYSGRASTNKNWYQSFQWGVIVLSASVPVMVASIPEGYQWITIAISILLAIGTAALKTFKFQENWVNYRTISETLKKELHFYNAALDDYANSEDAEAQFVERVESMISRENSLWVTTHKQNNEEKEKSGK
jgi:hypothetical protein